RNGAEDARKITPASHFQGLQVEGQSPASRLYCLPVELLDRISSIPQNGHAGEPRKGLLEQLQSLRGQLREKSARPADISAWPGRTGHVIDTCRVAVNQEYDRDGLRRLLCRASLGPRLRHDQVDVETDELSREIRKALDVPRGVSTLDGDVLPFD